MNNNDYLAHHGVKGMKWGVRRHQNYDGTRIKKSYYRFTYDNNGIYDAYRQNSSKEDWQKFLKSDAAQWLPKPRVDKYANKIRSYFTEDGYKAFNNKTLPEFEKTLDIGKIVIKKYINTPINNIIYKDKYQIVGY